MEAEIMLGDIYEEIAERLALARTKALMGERQEALGLFQGASLDFTRFRDVLRDFPGYHALEHAFEVTLQSLCSEDAFTQEALTETQNLANSGGKQKKRARRAA